MKIYSITSECVNEKFLADALNRRALTSRSSPHVVFVDEETAEEVLHRYLNDLGKKFEIFKKLEILKKIRYNGGHCVTAVLGFKDKPKNTLVLTIRVRKMVPIFFSA